mgnify:CR=1 FL=1
MKWNEGNGQTTQSQNIGKKLTATELLRQSQLNKKITILTAISKLLHDLDKVMKSFQFLRPTDNLFGVRPKTLK